MKVLDERFILKGHVAIIVIPEHSWRDKLAPVYPINQF